jgi:hypothetical protein
MSDTRYIPFWKKMAESRLPLLAHTGGEHTLPVINAAFADSKLLRTPLECGVTVIAAHCGTRSGFFDHDYFDDWVAMLREFPNLYGDISALVSLNRCAHLRDCLREEIAPPRFTRQRFPCPRPGSSTLAARFAGSANVSTHSKDRQSTGTRLAIQTHPRIFGRHPHARFKIA